MGSDLPRRFARRDMMPQLFGGEEAVNQERPNRARGKKKNNADQASTDVTSQALALLQVDLEQVYQEHRSYTNRIHSMVAVALTIASAPMVVGAALLSSNVVSRPELESLSAAPAVLGLVSILAGAANTVPLTFIVDSQINALYCVRAINRFRGVYVDLMRLAVPGMEQYKPFLPVGSHGIRSFKATGTTGVLAAALSLINGLYVASGVVIMTRLAQAWFFPLLIVCSGAGYGVYALKTLASDREWRRHDAELLRAL